MTEAVIISIHLLRKSMEWFLLDNGLRHERVNLIFFTLIVHTFQQNLKRHIF